MSDTETVVVDENKQAEDDFAAGFDTVLTPETAVAAGDEAKSEVKSEVKAGFEDGAEVAVANAEETVEAAEPVAETPEFVQITKEQLAAFQGAADKTVSIESQLSKAFGTLGDVQQIVRTLQAATPAGMNIEIPDDAFADMAADYPDLAAQVQTALARTFKNVRGAAPAAGVDSVKVEQIVHDVTAKREMEDLTSVHPEWRNIVGVVDEEGNVDPTNAFRKWLGAQPTRYQSWVNGTESASAISGAIDAFQRAGKTPECVTKNKLSPKNAARAARIQEAIQPKGDGGMPPSGKSAEDDFHEGFRIG